MPSFLLFPKSFIQFSLDKFFFCNLGISIGGFLLSINPYSYSLVCRILNHVVELGLLLEWIMDIDVDLDNVFQIKVDDWDFILLNKLHMREKMGWKRGHSIFPLLHPLVQSTADCAREKDK